MISNTILPMNKDKRAARGKEELTNSHNHHETSAEAAEVQYGGAGTLTKVIRVGASRADPVGDRGQHVGSDDEKRVVDLPEGAGEDDEEESDGEDEGKGDDSLEPGGRHLGYRWKVGCGVLVSDGYRSRSLV